MAMTVLLVDDDADLRDLTAYALRRDGFAVIEAGSGPEALRRLKMDQPDIIILDIGLPRQDGIDVLRTLRQSGNSTPVIMLTGRRTEQDVVQCFTLSADDYVTKPFSAKELALRVRAVLRHVRGEVVMTREPITEVGTLRVDPETHEVRASGQSVGLTPIEFRILYLLASNPNRVVTTNRLLAYVWGHDEGDVNLLRTHISRVRRKLAVHGAGQESIVCINSVGYRFVSDGHAERQFAAQTLTSARA